MMAAMMVDALVCYLVVQMDDWKDCRMADQ
jgi:hypothetical protein